MTSFTYNEKDGSRAMAVNISHPVNASRDLNALAQNYVEGVEMLRSDWQDDNAGMVWEILSLGLALTAEAANHYWDGLGNPHSTIKQEAMAHSLRSQMEEMISKATGGVA